MESMLVRPQATTMQAAARPATEKKEERMTSAILWENGQSVKQMGYW